MKVVDLHFGPDDGEYSHGATVHGADYPVRHRRLPGAVDAAEPENARPKRPVLRGISILKPFEYSCLASRF